MKYFFSFHVPIPSDILVLESGPREVAAQALPKIRAIFPQARCHLCTCWSEPPAETFASVYRVQEFPSVWDKLRLLWSFRRRRWPVLVVLWTNSPILWCWKTLALLFQPAKVLVINENADFFWLQWSNRGILRQLLQTRWGLQRAVLFRIGLAALVFPITLLVLVATAGVYYARRWRRLLVWRIQAWGLRNTKQAQAAPLFSPGLSSQDSYKGARKRPQ
ncbi:MAG: hypothetical protein HY647_06010 [Acidobacteria bacterium]|nr:hypothetical protein [Acidobacteriota bacterium]